MEHPRPRIIAHRGASGWRPEHTEAAVRLAARLGADAVEPDLVATRDGELIVRHDVELSETTDIAERPEFASRRRTLELDGRVLTGWFAQDCTWAEIATLRTRERLPQLRPANARFDGEGRVLRFAELLDLAAETGLDVVAELKHATHHESIGLPLDALLAEAVTGSRWDSPGALTVESFEESVLRGVREQGVDARLVYLMEADGVASDVRATLGDAAPSYAEQRSGAALEALGARVDAVSVDKRVLLDDAGAAAAFVECARAAGLGVITWTLRPENAFLAPEHRLGAHPAAWGDWRREWSALAALGLEAVFADHPDLARRAFGD